MKGYRKQSQKARGNSEAEWILHAELDRELLVDPQARALSEILGQDIQAVCREGLDGLARAGARAVLETALRAEVTEFLGRLRYERGGAETGYRNGGRVRPVTCGSGSFKVRIPKITGAGRPFQGKTLKAYERTSDLIEEVIPLLYAEGLSVRDFGRALKPFWREAGLSRSSVSRANKRLYVEFDAWRKRDLSGVDVVYLFLDGYHERVRFGTSEKEGVLVAHAICGDGSREMLGLGLGPKESTEAWSGVVEDLKRRGLREPCLVISDGAPGLIAGVKASWPSVPRQRCVVHKVRNVVNRVPKAQQRSVEADVKKVFAAACLEEAIAAAESFLGKWGERFPTACEVFARDVGDCLTFYRFPEHHWKRIRTSNVLERAFKEARRRTRVVERFPTERSALVLIWASMEQDRLKWHGVKMSPELLDGVREAAAAVMAEPLRVDCAERYLEAA